MLALWLVVVLLSCGAAGPATQSETPPPPAGDAGPVTTDAGAQFFAAQITYDFATSVSCTPPAPGNTMAHCAQTNPKIAEAFRSRILTDYGDCAITGYNTGLVSIDCAGKCSRRGEVACGLQNLAVWNCPAERFTSSSSCSWFAY